MIYYIIMSIASFDLWNLFPVIFIHFHEFYCYFVLLQISTHISECNVKFIHSTEVAYNSFGGGGFLTGTEKTLNFWT